MHRTPSGTAYPHLLLVIMTNNNKIKRKLNECYVAYVDGCFNEIIEKIPTEIFKLVRAK